MQRLSNTKQDILTVVMFLGGYSILEFCLYWHGHYSATDWLDDRDPISLLEPGRIVIREHSAGDLDKVPMPQARDVPQQSGAIPRPGKNTGLVPVEQRAPHKALRAQ